jgi:hypothetical protein
MSVVGMTVVVRMLAWASVDMRSGIVSALFFRRVTCMRVRERRQLSADETNEHEGRNTAAEHQKSLASTTFKVTPRSLQRQRQPDSAGEERADYAVFAD